MNSLADKEVSAACTEGVIVIRMQGRPEIRFAVVDNPRLAVGSPAQLNNIEISPFGLHWPDLDEDLSFQGLLEGNHGQFAKQVKSLAN